LPAGIGQGMKGKEANKYSREMEERDV